MNIIYDIDESGNKENTFSEASGQFPDTVHGNVFVNAPSDNGESNGTPHVNNVVHSSCY